MSVYLIHFDRPIGNKDNRRGQAQHYIGYASDIEARLAEHRAGNGSKIMAAVQQAGIGWRVARIWDGDRTFERKLKNLKATPRMLCPICRGEYVVREETEPAGLDVTDEEVCNGSGSGS